MYEEQGCKLFIYGVNQNMISVDLQAEFEKFGQGIDIYNIAKGFTFFYLPSTRRWQLCYLGEEQGDCEWTADKM